MVKNIACTNPQRLKEIFEADSSSRQIDLPIYQRGFDWKPKHFDDFWSDLNEINDNQDPDELHFYGLIYSEGDNPNSDRIKLVDGQQRLTTSYLALIAIRDFLFRRIEFNQNKGQIVIVKQVTSTTSAGRARTKLEEKTVDSTIQNFFESSEYKRNHPEFQSVESMLTKLESRLYNMDSATQTPDYNKPLIQLGKLNREFFRIHVVPRKFPKNKINNMKSHITNDSIKKLLDAYSFFEDAISDLLSTANNMINDYQHINGLAWSLLDRFIVIRISVPTEQMAYDMFESINNRGTSLHNADLVKHKIFSFLDKEFSSSPDDTRGKLLDGYDESWEDIRNNVTGPATADYAMDSFLFHFLVTQQKSDISSSGVLKEIESKLEDDTLQASTLIDNLKECSKLFLDLRRPTQSNFDLRTYPLIKFYLDKIKSLEAIHIYNPLLVAYQKLYLTGDTSKKHQFSELLKILTRYMIRNKTFGGIRAKPVEIEMITIMNLIKDGKSNNEIIDELTNNKPTDSYISEPLLREKISNYKEKWSSNIDILYFVLEEINRQSAPGVVSGPDITDEHILPKTLRKQWKTHLKSKMSMTDEQVEEFHKEYRHKLGNRTLLSDSANKQSATKLYSEKTPYYRNDGYEITKKLTQDYTEWTKSEIDKRDTELIDEIIKILDLSTLKTP